MRKLYWFRHDLRLNDNPGLLAQADADRLLLVYIWPQNRPWCNVTGMGVQRERFLRESLQALQRELQKLGQNLLVLHGSPETIIPDLVRDYGIDRAATSRAPGYYERKAVEQLRQRLDIPLAVHETGTLFTEQQLPFVLDDLPSQFTPFRRLLDATRCGNPLPRPDALPRPPAVAYDAIPAAQVRPHIALPISGGSLAANRRLCQFVFEDQDIVNYKETRNCLDALAGSSTLSPWLANGCISPREVSAAIHRLETSTLPTNPPTGSISNCSGASFFTGELCRTISVFSGRVTGMAICTVARLSRAVLPAGAPGIPTTRWSTQ
jgi:deoxyribodipyrimidine photo-lyase